ncbi:MAG: SAM-dependent methyltransferase [Candidatus Azotimanducaceae bacterium]|jgi:SAM-dependent methyltransferase
MASHQEIAGVSDQDLVMRMVKSHDERFDDAFWRYVEDQVQPHLPEYPRIVDLGCGPGLFVRDLGNRISGANLYGYDLTPAMVEYAKTEVEYSGSQPEFDLLDVTANPVPLEDDSVHLLTMTAVLHVLDDPLATCAEIKRLLAPGGVFLLQDWVRQPLAKYLAMMMANVPPHKAEILEKAMMRLSVAHNKYTVEDWLWLLDKGGLKVLHHAQIRSEHFCTFVCQER